LLGEVESWINGNDKDAQDSFEGSAREVIMKLKTIQTKMLGETAKTEFAK
jgi:hypothetical protein